MLQQLEGKIAINQQEEVWGGILKIKNKIKKNKLINKEFDKEKIYILYIYRI